MKILQYVFRSNKAISVQIIDDLTGTTLVSASSLCKEIAAVAGTKTEKAALAGKFAQTLSIYNPINTL